MSVGCDVLDGGRGSIFGCLVSRMETMEGKGRGDGTESDINQKIQTFYSSPRYGVPLAQLNSGFLFAFLFFFFFSPFSKDSSYLFQGWDRHISR